MKKYDNKMVEYSLKKKHTDFMRTQITCSTNAYDVVRKFYGDDLTIYESFFILLLDRGNNTIGYVKISQGGIVGTVVDSKLIAKYCINSLASGVILAHNHPSGNRKPSPQDIELTDKLKEVMKLIGSQILDHIIITEDGYSSMADDGMI